MTTVITQLSLCHLKKGVLINDPFTIADSFNFFYANIGKQGKTHINILPSVHKPHKNIKYCENSISLSKLSEAKISQIIMDLKYNFQWF